MNRCESNYHYILVEVDGHKLEATMNRLEMKEGVARWSQPDSVTILTGAPRDRRRSSGIHLMKESQQ